MPDRRPTPRRTAYLIPHGQKHPRHGREVPPLGVRRGQLPADRVGEQPPHPHPGLLIRADQVPGERRRDRPDSDRGGRVRRRRRPGSGRSSPGAPRPRVPGVPLGGGQHAADARRPELARARIQRCVGHDLPLRPVLVHVDRARQRGAMQLPNTAHPSLTGSSAVTYVMQSGADRILTRRSTAAFAARSAAPCRSRRCAQARASARSARHPTRPAHPRSPDRCRRAAPPTGARFPGQ